MISGIVVALVVADVLSGLFHWAEDTYGTRSESWISKNIWEPNIEHHREPTLFILMGSVAGRNYLQVIAASLAAVALWYVGMLGWQAGLALVVLALANEIHAWSHQRNPPRLVQLLQEMAILQTRQHHAKHHQAPYATRYCVITNWCNPILDGVRFWRLLEAMLSPVLTVKRGHPSREGY